MQAPNNPNWVDRFDGAPRKGCDILVQVQLAGRRRFAIDMPFCRPLEWLSAYWCLRSYLWRWQWRSCCARAYR